MVVFQPKECPRCERCYCFDCINREIAVNKKWKCRNPKCNSEEAVVEQHRVIKEVLDQLIFKCPQCSQKRSYNDMINHLKNDCGAEGGSLPIMKKESSLVQATKQVESLSVQSMKGLDIYIMEKDSKKFYIYNTLDQQVHLHQINTNSNFPHNFQAIQVGTIETKAFIVGGGDFNALPDTMFQMNQIVKDPNGQSYNYEAQEKMKYPRHGHSCCSLGENFIVVTGSRKDVQKANIRTEVFNTDENKWYEMGTLNQGRHYHSSCSYNNSYVYIFCGISNETKKYLNTIERVQFNP
jgi:hypothetical protein